MGQTLGARFESDGRWKGQESVQTIECDQTKNACQIKVPAPGAALVFFSDSAQQAAVSESVATYPTTVITQTKNTVTIDATLLATSNGHNGKTRGRGGTSAGGANGAMGSIAAPGIGTLFSVLACLSVYFGISL